MRWRLTSSGLALVLAALTTWLAIMVAECAADCGGCP